MQPTKLTYLEDFTILESSARVLDVLQENNKTVILLDHTIFYPQGGGQPYDEGIIENASGRFLVKEVRFVDGIVKHIGIFEYGLFNANDIVICHVEKERRYFHSRLHSAGHIVDMAIHALALHWKPGKGYHFPDGPYVEYEGSLVNLDKEMLKQQIEDLCNKFIAEARNTTTIFMDKEQMHTVCHHVPAYLPEGKPARVVLYGDFGVPCGGTHVSNLKDVGKITIRKIKQEGLFVRVGYQIGTI